MQTNINPTRMELRKMRIKLQTAQKGHQLLKDKTNELIRNFYIKIKENKESRQSVERNLKKIFSMLETAKTRLNRGEISLLFSMPNRVYTAKFNQDSFLNVVIPSIVVEENILDKNMPYSPLSSTVLMDETVSQFFAIYPQIIALAQLEKTTILLAHEIEKCKRRVNALENVVIPEYERIIDEIELKLAEAELGNISRLKKIKAMITEDDEE